MPANPYDSLGTFNYFNPGTNYGSPQFQQSTSFEQSPLGNQYFEQNRGASFTRFLAMNGFRDNSALGDYARAQESKIHKGYESALGANPDLNYHRDYLNQDLSGRIRNDFLRLTPGQRGESTSQFAPRARTQRWM
jgi:hypothetical protein